VIPVLKKFVTLKLEISYAPIITMKNVINWKILILALLQKHALSMIPDYFSETGIVVVLNCFGKKNLVYASISRIVNESAFYDIVVKKPTTMIKNQLTFIWLLQKVTHHKIILGTPLLQISRLNHVDFII